jgi:hypothetical protein
LVCGTNGITTTSWIIRITFRIKKIQTTGKG